MADVLVVGLGPATLHRGPQLVALGRRGAPRLHRRAEKRGQ
jgi:hypothetical protein